MFLKRMMFRKRFFAHRLFNRKEQPNNENNEYKTSKMPEMIFAGIGEVVKECHDKHLLTSCLAPVFKQTPKAPVEKKILGNFDKICQENDKNNSIVNNSLEEKPPEENLRTEDSQKTVEKKTFKSIVENSNLLTLPKAPPRTLPPLPKRETISKIIPSDDIYSYCKFTSKTRPVTDDKNDTYQRTLTRCKSRVDLLNGESKQNGESSTTKQPSNTISISDFVPITSIERTKRPEIKNGRPAGQVNRNSINNRSRKVSRKYSGMGTIWKAPGAATTKPPMALHPTNSSLLRQSSKIVAHAPGHKFGVTNHLKRSSLAGPGMWVNKP